MRLLFCIPERWPTHRSDVSTLFGKYLPRYGLHTDLVASSSSTDGVPAEWGGGDAFIHFAAGQAKRHLLTLLHGVWRMSSAKPVRYDAVQVRDMPLLAALGLLAARCNGLRFFYWMSYPIPEGQIASARERGLSQGLIKFLFPWIRGRVGRFLLYRLVLPSADHVFVQSERMKRDMVGFGVAAERMTPVPMGVDMELVGREQIQPIFDASLRGKRVLVYLGTLDPARKIEVLFEMLALVRQTVPDAALLLVGDTGDDQHRRWLKQKAEVCGVAEHVIWTGWVPMSEAWRYVCSAEIGLSPFPRGFLLDSASPTKVAEYLALHIPVVCNDNPDQQQILSQTRCGLCVPYTAEQFARAVLELLDSSESVRRRMVVEGHAYVANSRAYDRIALQLSDVYARVLGQA